MMDLQLISTPISESWTAWVMLSLLASILIANQRQNGLFKSAFHDVWSVEERSYSEVGTDFVQWLLLSYFRIGTPSLALYVFYYQPGKFSILCWLMIMGIWFSVEMVKTGAIYMIRYIFGLEKLLQNIWRYYSEVWILVGSMLYPVLLLTIQIGVTPLTNTLLYIVLAILLILILVKSIRLLLVKPMAAIYILIYFITLELLPLGFLFWAIWKIA